MSVGYVDVFLELDGLSEPINGALPEALRGYYWANTPAIPLPNGRYLYFARVAEAGLAPLLRDNALRERVVGYSWDGLWDRPYEHRDHIFMASVRTADGGVKRLPLAQISPGDEVVDGVARPPGVFSGDAVMERPLPSHLKRAVVEQESRKLLVVSRLLELKEIVRAANDLSEAERDKLLAYIEASERLLGIAQPDAEAVERILRRAAKYAKAIGSTYVKAKLIDGLEWIISTLFM